MALKLPCCGFNLCSSAMVMRPCSEASGWLSSCHAHRKSVGVISRLEQFNGSSLFLGNLYFLVILPETSDIILRIDRVVWNILYYEVMPVWDKLWKRPQMVHPSLFQQLPSWLGLFPSPAPLPVAQREERWTVSISWALSGMLRPLLKTDR